MVNDNLVGDIRQMLIQAKSPYNDGFTQDLYRKKLVEIQKLLNENLKEEVYESNR